jgi:hypothetical protein
VGCFSAVKHEPVTASHRQTRASTTTVAFMPMRTSLSWFSTDVVATTHGLIQRLLHSKFIVLLEAPVQHKLKFAVNDT